METRNQTTMDTAEHKTQSTAQTISDMKTKAQELGSTISEQASNTAAAVGQSINSLAGAVRQQAPTEGMIGSAASTVASQLEAAGSYLQDNSFENMARDITAMIRRYPLPSLLIGLNIGYWWARNSER